MEYQCHKWLQIYSTCMHFPIIPSFITYNCMCNYIDTTDATSGARTVYPFVATAFTLGFSVVHVTRSLFDEYVLLMFVCPFVLFLFSVCSSSIYGLWLPRWYLPTLFANYQCSEFQYSIWKYQAKKLCQASIQVLLLEQWKNDHIRQVTACSAKQWRIVSSVNILSYCIDTN